MYNNDWIKSLKPGDTVIINKSSSHQSENIATVDRVTPSGRVICNNITFNPDGWERGNRDGWYRKYITEATPEVIAAIKEKQLIDKARHMAGSVLDGKFSITSEQAQKLINVIEGNTTTQSAI